MCEALRVFTGMGEKALVLSGNPSTKDDGWHQRVFDTTEGTLSRRAAPQGDLLSENRTVTLVC